MKYKKRSKHEYSTFALFFLMVITLFGTAVAITSSEVDELCSTSDSFLFRNSSAWGCGSLPTVSNETDTLQSVTDNGANTTNDVIIDASATFNPSRNNKDFSVWGDGEVREEIIFVDASQERLQLAKNSNGWVDLYGRGVVEIGGSVDLIADKPSLRLSSVDPSGGGGNVWQLFDSSMTSATTGTSISTGRAGVLAGGNPSTGFMWFGAESDSAYNKALARYTDEDTFEIGRIFVGSTPTSAVAEDTKLQIFNDYTAKGTKDYFALTSTYASGNSNQGDVLIVKSSGNVGIGEQNPTYPLEVGTNVSGISAWFEGNVSATGYITRTYETHLTNKQAYDLVQYALANEYDLNGNYDHSVWGECYVPQEVNDKSKPIYQDVTKTEFIGIDLVETNITTQRLIGYEKKTVGGVNIDCKQVMLSKSQKHLTHEFDGGVAYFDEIYTKSKVPIPNYNYVERFKIDELDSKATHYAVETQNNKEVLNMEERIVFLEGAVAQLSVELCSESNNKYTWCDKK